MKYLFASDLQLITSYFNPCQYRSRRQNYERFITPILEAGLPLLTVEWAIGEQPFELPPAANIIQVRSKDVLWQKERLINLALRQLPSKVQKIAWLDCDVMFNNPKWAVEASQKLNYFPWIQLYQQAALLPQDTLGLDAAQQLIPGFVANFLHSTYNCCYGHTGFAWAAQRTALQYGLYDRLILGSADHLIAHIAMGDIDHGCIANQIGTAAAFNHFHTWANAVYPSIQSKVGYVSGVLCHLWHGELRNRQYLKRHQILVEHNFDPTVDIQLNQSGLWEWRTDKPELHQAVAEYFRRRKEDD